MRKIVVISLVGAAAVGTVVVVRKIAQELGPLPIVPDLEAIRTYLANREAPPEPSEVDPKTDRATQDD